MNRFMPTQNFFCLLLLFAFFSPAAAQQSSFVYMQTESNIPYTVQWNGVDYVSSSTGYLILPEAIPGDHVISISFSPEVSEDYTFTITVGDTPKGFSLRQAIDNSWSLFDMVDFSLLKGAVIVKPVVIETKPEIIPARPKDGLIIKNEAPVVKKERIIKPTNIQKIFDKSGSDGIDQVYIIINGNKTDTIALFIPVLGEVIPKQSVSNPSSFVRPSSSVSEISGVFTRDYINKRYQLVSSK